MEWQIQRNAPALGTALCQLHDIPDGQGKEFVFGSGDHAFRMFVVRRGAEVWGYLNRCPHFSIPVNVQPDRFVTSDHSLIMCANHTAMFRYDDGYCIDGPCRAASLDPVPVSQHNGMIQIRSGSDPHQRGETVMKFTCEMLTSRVVFGAGSLDQLPDELDRLGLSRVVILSTPEQQDQAQRVAGLIGSRAVTIFDQAVMHVPVETQNAAIQVVKDADIDGGVAIGGGSTTGLGKAIALELDFPFIAIPTTYAGSEMTPIWGLTAEGVKQTGRNERIRPRTVIYDPTLTLSLPTQLSGTSGMNASAHSVEGLYAEDANPIASLMAEESIRALANSLPQLSQTPQDIDVRAQALYGAWLAGVTLGSVGMALHRKLCHTLGGTFNLPHAETHTIVLPHAAAFNFPAAADARTRVARALGTENAAQGLYELAVTLQIPVALKDLGLQEADLDRAAQLATQNPYYNPRPFTQESIRTLLDNAFPWPAAARSIKICKRMRATRRTQ